MPHLPCCANLYFDGAIGNRVWPRGHRREPLAHADRVGQVLVVPLAHLRLVVVQVHLRRAADHVQVDDVLGLGGEVGQAAAGRRVGGPAPRPRPSRVAARAARPGAAQPTAFAPRPKNWRRVSLRTYSSNGFMARASLRRHRCASRHRARVTCSALRPGSSARWPASSRRPASAASSAGSGFDSPTASSFVGVLGVRLVVGEQVVERRLGRPGSSSARSGRASSRAAMKSIRSVGRRRRLPSSARCGQVPGGLDELRVVERDQRLQRRVGPLAADGADLAARGVEDVHRGRRRGPLPEGVQAAAVEALAAVAACSRGCCCRSWRPPPRRRRAGTA